MPKGFLANCIGVHLDEVGGYKRKEASTPLVQPMAETLRAENPTELKRTSIEALVQAATLLVAGSPVFW